MRYIPALLITLSLGFFLSGKIALARTTPEDIINAKKTTYNQKVSHYSTAHQQKLVDLSIQIASTNKQIAGRMERNVEYQGAILDEYLSRHGKLDSKSDVAHLTGNPIDDAHYWLTYAHEAVAYQAAKIYVFNLTSEANIKNDTLNTIISLSNDLNTLNGKIERSRQAIESLVNKP